MLDELVTSDRFFNFVVTAYSLVDWVKNYRLTPVAALTAIPNLYTDQWIKVCGDIANASKHFTLSRRVPVTHTVHSNSGYGAGRYGVGLYGIGEEGIEIELNDGTKIPGLHFVTEVLRVWRDFFSTHGL